MAPIAGKGERYDWRQGLPPHQRYLKIFATNGAGGLKANTASGNTSGFIVSPLFEPAALDRGGHYDLPHELTRDAEGKPVLYLELPANLLREDEP